MAIVGLAIQAYFVIVLITVVASWVGGSNPVFEFARRATEPVLAPIRRVVPTVGGLDFSPMILMVGLSLLARVF